jgi:hypothetical protein
MNELVRGLYTVFMLPVDEQIGVPGIGLEFGIVM